MISAVKKQFIPIPRTSLSLRFLYETRLGRILLRPMLGKLPSDLVGRYLDSPLSCWLIPIFIKKAGIELSDYVKCRYKNFNACFSRRIKPQRRPVDPDPTHLISPCDGLLRVYPITDDLVVPVKQSAYSVTDLIQDPELASEFNGGYCLVFRLCVNHYHRYCYPASGSKSADTPIPGLYHTVQPIALRNRPVFVENSRSYTLLKTREFGKILQMEVGALLVGKIKNHQPQAAPVGKGKEKGTFLYGGSTIILLLQKDRLQIPDWYLTTSQYDVEIPVKSGEWIGTAI